MNMEEAQETVTRETKKRSIELAMDIIEYSRIASNESIALTIGALSTALAVLLAGTPVSQGEIHALLLLIETDTLNTRKVLEK